MIGNPTLPPAHTQSSTATRPVTVVTGGSEGIGLAIAEVMAKRGHDLLIVARRPERLEAAAADIRSKHPVDVATLALDLTRADSMTALDAELARTGRHIHILVNNAAIGASGDFAQMDPDDLERLVALNVAVPSRLMRHVLPGMRERRGGGIMNIGSMGGYTPGPYQAAYYASKAYLISLSEAVAAEVRRDGVRVTVVVPGPVETRFHTKMEAEAALYRRLMPAATAADVARWGVLGFELGLRTVAPGPFNLIGVGALKLLPHIVLVPIMAWLLDPRRSSERGAKNHARGAVAGSDDRD
jgi:short-subunit dehydrogenase